MYCSLSIEGFRALRSFQLKNLKRCNLLVGANNCGKTTVLEAVELLGSRAYSDAKLLTSLKRRGEALVAKNGSERREFDLRHLFNGHQMRIGSRFEIRGKTATGEDDLCSVEIQQMEEEASPPVAWQAAHIVYSGGSHDLRLTKSGGLKSGPREGRGFLDMSDAWRVEFISTAAAPVDDLEEFWESIALTEGEEILIESLKAIEPDIERIAFVGFGRPFRGTEKGGFMIRRRSSSHPVPIGSLGDGIWRMFTIVMAGLHADCFLLVDEIDTGLHHTVMKDLWKIMAAMSKESDIQVFATTHSHDCVHSLASLVAEGEHPGVFSIHRIESDREESVALSEEEIAILAERDIEIR